MVMWFDTQVFNCFLVQNNKHLIANRLQILTGFFFSQAENFPLLTPYLKLEPRFSFIHVITTIDMYLLHYVLTPWHNARHLIHLWYSEAIKWDVNWSRLLGLELVIKSWWPDRGKRAYPCVFCSDVRLHYGLLSRDPAVSGISFQIRKL